ncbi:MAG: universal stress protein [Chitinophagaceae bacterium]|nr:universal stress protein [Chitinophagaceae bacterium]
MKRILVPTDFSPNADKAIDYAVQVAKRNEATLYLIHACDHLDPLYLENTLSKSAYSQAIADAAFEKLEMRRQSIEETENLLVNIQLYSGPVLDTILVAAEEHKAELIIMGTLGITGLRDKIFGSKTAALIAGSGIPVLAIPLEYDWSQPHRFLLAIRDPDEAIPLTDPVFELAGLFNAEMHIAIFTDKDEAGALDYLMDDRILNHAAEKLKEKHDQVIVTEHLFGHHFEDSINEYIAKNQVDLLAMITHKRSLLGRLFNHSMTRKMSYHTRVPVLAIPAK